MDRVSVVAFVAFRCNFWPWVDQIVVQDLERYSLDAVERVRGGLEETVDSDLQQFVKGGIEVVLEASCSGPSTKRKGDRSDGNQRPPVD